MDKRKIVIVMVLSIFLIGMLCGSASASHTFKKGKYKVKVSDKTYKKIKKGKKSLVKKVGTKKVTVWKTKKMKTYESWIDGDGRLYKSQSWDPYKKFGYKAKHVKTLWKYYDDGDICWEWYKVPKKVKKNVYLLAYCGWTGDLDTGHPNGKVHVELSTSKILVF